MENISSYSVFPYLLEPDKSMGFPFSTEINEFYSEIAMYPPGKFNPKHRPEDNWPAFIKEV